MSLVLLIAYILFIALFWSAAAGAVKQRKWGLLVLCLLPLGVYLVAVAAGFFALLATQQASDGAMNEMSGLVLGLLAVAGGLTLAIRHFVRKPVQGN